MYPNQLKKKKITCGEEGAPKLTSCLDLGSQDVQEIQHVCDFEVAKENLVYKLPNSLHLRWHKTSCPGRNYRIRCVGPEFHETGGTHPALLLCTPQQSCPAHGQKLQAPKSNFARSLRVTGHSKCLSRLCNKWFWKASLNVQFQNPNQTFISSVQVGVFMHL